MPFDIERIEIRIFEIIMKRASRPNLAERAWAVQRHKAKQPFQQPEAIWENWITTRNPKMKDLLCRHNYRLASKVAHQWEALCELELEDLEQLASIGLLKAIDRFNPSLGNKFSSYAMPWIKGEILHFLRDRGRLYSVPRKAREIKASVIELHRLLLKDGGSATLEECAAAKGIAADEWEWICEATEKRSVGELNEAIHVPVEESSFEDEQTYAAIQRELSALPDGFERTCVIEHFWGGLKAEEIAKKQKRSEQEVKEAIASALTQLRNTAVVQELEA